MSGLSKTFSGALLATTMFVAPAAHAEEAGATTASYAPKSNQTGVITDYTGEELKLSKKLALSKECSFLQSTGKMKRVAELKASVIADEGRDVCLYHTEDRRGRDTITLAMDGKLVGQFNTQTEMTAVTACEEMAARGVEDPKAVCDRAKQIVVNPDIIVTRNQL